MTEELNEYNKAFCLCGEANCRGKYLELVKSKDASEYLDKKY